ncbi:MAG: tRNA nucleotidyltransferase (CCA-adding enzyme) [Parasphingorhabdus sp.]|jgi:tRNA nucleotidyltransferase (CCA-adding enzyme)
MSNHLNLQCYLVGGAVRDSLLGKEVVDRDWVVVGSTPKQMTSLGFKPVGRDFPVFLHPENGEEYALARTERKTAKGYKGFSVWADPSVTLEQDLLRRDLTINAMAMDGAGKIIDPFGGQQDLQGKILRHVSEAFSEDPLRVLRVARFMARLGSIGFTVHSETNRLMQKIVAAGEMPALTTERVWQECHLALGAQAPHYFISTLKECGALHEILPEIDNLFGVPQPAEHHPEIDSGLHTLLALERSASLTDKAHVRFAALVHDLGKALTDPNDWPRHIDHENKGVPLVEALCSRLRVPTKFTRLAVNVCRYHLLMHQLDRLRPVTVLKLLSSLDAFRNPENVADFVIACQADSQGRTGRENQPYPAAELMHNYLSAAKDIDLSDLAKSKLEPQQKAQLVEQRRLKAIELRRN